MIFFLENFGVFFHPCSSRMMKLCGLVQKPHPCIIYMLESSGNCVGFCYLWLCIFFELGFFAFYWKNTSLSMTSITVYIYSSCCKDKFGITFLAFELVRFLFFYIKCMFVLWLVIICWSWIVGLYLCSVDDDTLIGMVGQ